MLYRASEDYLENQNIFPILELELLNQLLQGRHETFFRKSLNFQVVVLRLI